MVGILNFIFAISGLKCEKHNIGAIFKTGLKYLTPPSPSLRVMTKDETKIRLKPFVTCSKTKKNVLTRFWPEL